MNKTKLEIIKSFYKSKYIQYIIQKNDIFNKY